MGEHIDEAMTPGFSESAQLSIELLHLRQDVCPAGAGLHRDERDLGARQPLLNARQKVGVVKKHLAHRFADGEIIVAFIDHNVRRVVARNHPVEIEEHIAHLRAAETTIEHGVFRKRTGNIRPDSDAGRTDEQCRTHRWRIDGISRLERLNLRLVICANCGGAKTDEQGQEHVDLKSEIERMGIHLANIDAGIGLSLAAD